MSMRESTAAATGQAYLELVLQRLPVSDGDDPLLANLLHGTGNQLSDFLLSVC